MSAERRAAARVAHMRNGIAACAAAPDLIGALTVALVLHDQTLPTIPVGGGFAITGAARTLATFLVDTLAEAGWTQPKETQ